MSKSKKGNKGRGKKVHLSDLVPDKKENKAGEITPVELRPLPSWGGTPGSETIIDLPQDIMKKLIKWHVDRGDFRDGKYILSAEIIKTADEKITVVNFNIKNANDKDATISEEIKNEIKDSLEKKVRGLDLSRCAESYYPFYRDLAKGLLRYGKVKVEGIFVVLENPQKINMIRR
ncbi:MAG: hypothetical protein QW474_03605 [Candidatus Aenigmatarchaeota archaeon]